tara:strand:+ start:133 stop:402 length:270 start_codon:yes stop_codon:yes gene_type:complete
MAKGKKTGGGSRAGVPNKATQDVRAAIAAFASANVGQMSVWLAGIDDPAKKLDLYLKAIEYHIPKLARSEVSGPNGGPVETICRWQSEK